MSVTITLPTIYQQIIHKSRYARWNEEHNRRENWDETVARYVNFFIAHLQEKFDCSIGRIGDPNSPADQAFQAISRLEVMPSMRCMMTAGPALQREPMCAFNCVYRAIDSVSAFSEIMYVLMCGSGVGFSVERQFTGQLPMVPKRLKPSAEIIYVADSRLGWATAYQTLLERLYAGNIPSWDVSQVRPAGSRLKTMGGYASGPGPLIDLFEFTIRVFKEVAGDRLNSLACHDIACKIGDIVVMGGVRRSALISLSNPSDLRMRYAKSGNWYQLTPWRALANNSACYTERPAVGVFMEEWLALFNSKSGERGIVNRKALLERCASLGRRTHWDDFHGVDHEPEDTIDFGVNPCSEIILRSKQTCNLSEAVARPHDTIDSLKHKASCASMLGTWQASLSEYGFVDAEWRRNAEEERLLGVSVTGIMDNPILANRHLPEFGQAFLGMHDIAYQINRAWAKRLKINDAAAITCVKPSGTVSQLVDASSGVHDRYAPFYVRRIIMDNHDPMCQFMVEQGLPCEDSVYKPGKQTVFMFPMRSPTAPNHVLGDAEKGMSGDFSRGRSAIEQLEHWSAVNRHWADHSVSCTIEVADHEWPQVGGWVWEHFDHISGVSFLPKTNSVYQQMPYTPCGEEDIRELESIMPPRIDWNKLSEYEKVDNTKVSQELACTAGGCTL